MLSYTFYNGKIKRETITEICKKEFDLKTVRDNDELTFLKNKLITILIKEDYTHIVLSSENVNIQNIEAIF